MGTLSRLGLALCLLAIYVLVLSNTGAVSDELPTWVFWMALGCMAIGPSLLIIGDD